MAKLNCEFFPDSPATWNCVSCGTHYGDQCIPAGHSVFWGRSVPSCIRCSQPLRFLGNATGAKPFWQMLPHFFAYPLHPNGLMAIGLLTVIGLLPSFLGIGLLALFGFLFCLAVVVKYGFAIIEERGYGNPKPPQVSAVITGDQEHLFLKQIAVFFLMGVAAFAAGRLGELPELLVLCFVSLATPASIMVLAVEKSVRRALNPLALTALMLAVGWPYLLLWFCAQIIMAGPTYAYELMALFLPDGMIYPVLIVLAVYFAFVLYTMLGYVLFEYQHELGFDVPGDEEDDDLDQQAFDKAKALGEATVLIKDAKYSQAREVLRKTLDLVPDDVDLHLHYHKLLMLLDDEPALANHCEYFLGILERQRQLERGVPVLLDTQSRIPKFQLKDTHLAVEMAKLLRRQGNHKAVLGLFLNRHKTHPDDPLLPAAYLQVAQVFFEYLNQDAKALSVCEFILKQFPDCPQRPAFEKLMTTIRQSKASHQPKAPA